MLVCSEREDKDLTAKDAKEKQSALRKTLGVGSLHARLAVEVVWLTR